MADYNFQNIPTTIIADELFSLLMKDILHLLTTIESQLELLFQSKSNINKCKKIAKVLLKGAKQIEEWRLAYFNQLVQMNQQDKEKTMPVYLLCIELRAPLSAFIGFTELISFGTSQDKHELESFIMNLQQNLQRILPLAKYVDKHNAFPWHGEHDQNV